MAKTVFNTETIELLDGSTVLLRPLNIKGMKKFQARFAELQKVEDAKDDEAIDGLVDLAQICLKVNKAEIAEDRDALEETLDLDSMYRIIEVSTGIRLNDPNLVRAVAEALGE